MPLQVQLDGLSLKGLGCHSLSLGPQAAAAANLKGLRLYKLQLAPAGRPPAGAGAVGHGWARFSGSIAHLVSRNWRVMPGRQLQAAKML